MSNPHDQPLDRLERLAVDMEHRQHYSERNRLALLAAHGVGAVLASILLSVDKASTTIVAILGDLTGPFNLLPLFGGTMLLVGLAWGRNLWLEAIGMGIILAWDVGMAGLFAYSASIFGPRHDATVASYPLAVYGTLGALMIIHLVTLITIIRGRHHA